MSKFLEILNSLGTGDDGSALYPDTFTTDITAAYDEDMSLPAARIGVLEADLAAAQAEILLLKAHNYELITAAPVVDDVNDDNSEPDGSDDNDNDDEGVDSLFGKVEN